MSISISINLPQDNVQVFGQQILFSGEQSRGGSDSKNLSTQNTMSKYICSEEYVTVRTPVGAFIQSKLLLALCKL